MTYPNGAAVPDAIWLKKEGSTVVRIHAEALSITVGDTQLNAPKPVIEVPYSLIEKRNLPTYTVTFESNGGTDIPERRIEAGNTIGSLPTPEKDGYMFFGWYDAPELYGKNEVYPETIVDEDVTYYARWVENSSEFPVVFHESNACTFNGTSINTANPITGDYCRFADGEKNFIDTGIMLFSDITHGGVDNYNKDFEIGFDIASYNYRDQSSDNTQATFLNSKLEKSNTYPGFVIRKSSDKIQLTGKFNNVTTNTATNPTASTVNRIRIKRENGAIYYSFNDDEFELLANSNLVSATEYFDTTVWLGAYPLDSNNTPMQRPIKATLTDMYIKLAN